MNKLAVFAVALIMMSSIVISVSAIEASDSLRARLAVRRNKLKAVEQAPQVPQQVQASIPEASAVAGAGGIVQAAETSFVETQGMESSEAEMFAESTTGSNSNSPHTTSTLDEYDAMLEARIKSSIDAFTNAINQINRISELPKRPDVRPLAESMSKIQAIQDAVEAAMKAKDDFDARQAARVQANVGRLMEIVREEEARLHKAEDEYRASIKPVLEDAQQALSNGESALDQSLKNTAASLGLSIASLGTSASTVANSLTTVSNALQNYMQKAIRAQIAVNNPELATMLGIPVVTDPSTRLPPPPNSNSGDVGGLVQSLAETSSKQYSNGLSNLLALLFGNSFNTGSNLLNSGGNMLNSGGNALNSGGNALNSGGNALNSGGNMLNSGGNALNSGGNALNSGGNALNSGGNALNSGGNALNSGGNALNSGGNSLNSGGNLVNGN